MSEIGFSHPWLLLLALFPVALPIIRRVAGLRRQGTVCLSTYDWLPASATGSFFPERLALLLRLAALACLIVIAAGFHT